MSARADSGLYGRFEGDMVLSAALGAGVATRERDGVAHLDLRALYLDSAGLLLSTERLDGATGLATAVELRPLFLARFFYDLWAGSSLVDLVLDSIGLELGSWVGPLGGGTGAGLWLGGGVAVPLTGARSGWHLRLHARYLHAPANDRAAPNDAPTGLRVLAALEYAGVIDTGWATREIRSTPPLRAW